MMCLGCETVSESYGQAVTRYHGQRETRTVLQNETLERDLGRAITKFIREHAHHKAFDAPGV